MNTGVADGSRTHYNSNHNRLSKSWFNPALGDPNRKTGVGVRWGGLGRISKGYPT